MQEVAEDRIAVSCLRLFLGMMYWDRPDVINLFVVYLQQYFYRRCIIFIPLTVSFCAMVVSFFGRFEPIL